MWVVCHYGMAGVIQFSPLPSENNQVNHKTEGTRQEVERCFLCGCIKTASRWEGQSYPNQNIPSKHLLQTLVSTQYVKYVKKKHVDIMALTPPQSTDHNVNHTGCRMEKYTHWMH